MSNLSGKLLTAMGRCVTIIAVTGSGTRVNIGVPQAGAEWILSGKTRDVGGR